MLQKVTNYLFILSIYFSSVTYFHNINFNRVIMDFYFYIFSTNIHISDTVYYQKY